MQKTFVEQQKVDTIWPLSLLAITLVGNWLLYFRLGHTDPSFLYISLASVGTLCLLMFALRLNTEINAVAIRYKMFPFHFKWREIPFIDIATKEIRTYKPLTEYGGWGLRYGKSGTAYTIRGKTGLQLTLKKGTKILIGTSKADEMSKILK